MIISEKLKNKRILLAHDSFTQAGGAERVFEAIMELFPDSPVFTLASEEEVLAQLNFKPKHLIHSVLQNVYQYLPKFQYLFPLIPIALKFDHLSGYDLIISSSSAYIKGLNKRGAKHINYCHTPTRFVWSDYNYALSELPKVLWPLAKLYLSWLKGWDLRAVSGVDFFLANSIEVQKRIKMFYNRTSVLVHPFVDTQFFKPSAIKKDYFLIAGRLAPYKGHDKVIQIFNKLQLPLHVVGTGRNEKYLKSIAGPTIHFFGRISDLQLKEQYSSALAFIYPQVEDFGLMPLEAAACGAPTIAVAAGGSLETVLPGKTGEFFLSENLSELEGIVKNFDPAKYSRDDLLNHAQNFNKEKFQTKFLLEIEKYL